MKYNIFPSKKYLRDYKRILNRGQYDTSMLESVVDKLSNGEILDKNVKKQFQEFCESVGLNPSVAINMYIHNVIQNQKLPFSIKSPNKETLEALEESEYMLKHLDEYKGYNSAKELFDDIGR